MVPKVLGRGKLRVGECASARNHSETHHRKKFLMVSVTREGIPSTPRSRSTRTGWDASRAVRSAAARELPADVLEAGVRRLAGLSLVTGVMLLVPLGLGVLLLPADAPVNWALWWGTLVPGAVLSAGVAAVARWVKWPAQSVINVGFLYLLVISLLIGLFRHAQPWPVMEPLRQWSPVAVLILAFAVLIPALPTKVLVLSLLAATMEPLALYLLRSTVPMPPPDEAVLLLASPYLGAVLAVAAARVLHQLSEGIAKAREVGGYELVEQLGSGGMAEVWRAEHAMLARPAAIKMIRHRVLVQHGPDEAERMIRLFLREAQATARLRSPHTVEIYDFGTTREGEFYFVMELLEGVDLQSLVERFGRQPPERVAHLVRHVCHSLHEAHLNDLVHRDVKPGNIYTCHYGAEYDFAKVLDFGLVMDRHPTAEELEDEARFVGTPSVMAPEMVRFQSEVDARADLYALGCVAYWLLTGQRVFEAQTRHDMLVMHAHQRPKPPSQRVGQPLHEPLEALIMECLDKNPNRRPQSASELGERLAALEFAEAWTPERARSWWRTHLARPSDPDLDVASSQTTNEG